MLAVTTVLSLHDQEQFLDTLPMAQNSTGTLPQSLMQGARPAIQLENLGRSMDAPYTLTPMCLNLVKLHDR
jgi:hypothetical protein